MKKIALRILFLVVPFFASAQSITINQINETCSKGEQPAFQMLIPQATLKNVGPDWQRYLRTKAKGKIQEQGGETIMYGAVNKNVAPQGFNVISKLLETTDGVMITAWFMRSDSAFMSNSTDANQVLAVKKYLNDFGVAQYQNVVKNQLKTENDKLTTLQNDLKGMIKDEEKANKSINENDRSISRTKTSIRTNENDQKNKQAQIAAQKQVVESLKATPGDAAKAADKTLKQMESDLKKLVNQNEKLNKQIDKWEADIRESGRAIDRSKSDQSVKNGEIEKQNAIVQSLQNKLDGIK